MAKWLPYWKTYVEHFSHHRGFHWTGLLWQKFVAPYPFLGWFTPFEFQAPLWVLGDLILRLWEKPTHLWLTLPSDSKDPSPKVHFRYGSIGLPLGCYGIISRHSESSPLNYITWEENIPSGKKSLRESEGLLTPFLLAPSKGHKLLSVLLGWSPTLFLCPDLLWAIWLSRNDSEGWKQAEPKTAVVPGSISPKSRVLSVQRRACEPMTVARRGAALLHCRLFLV